MSGASDNFRRDPAALERAVPPVPPDQRRWLLCLLVAAVLVQDLVWVLVLRGSRDHWPGWPAIVAMGLAFCQVGLAAMLLLLPAGSGRLVRLAVASLFYFAAAYLACRAAPGHFQIWMGIMLLDVAIVAAPLGAARLAGMRVVPLDRLGDLPPASRQYSILGILLLTTLVALLLGIARAIATWGDVAAVAVFAMGLGSIPWLCGPLMLSGFHWRWSIVAGALVCPLAGYAISNTGFPPNHPVELIAMCYAQGLLTIAACGVVRVAGYRLVWPSVNFR